MPAQTNKKPSPSLGVSFKRLFPPIARGSLCSTTWATCQKILLKSQQWDLAGFLALILQHGPESRDGEMAKCKIENAIWNQGK